MSPGHVHRRQPSLLRATALPQTSARGRASRATMADLAGAFIETLSEVQRKETLWPFEDGERFNWHYVPRERAGLPIATDPASVAMLSASTLSRTRVTIEPSARPCSSASMARMVWN